MIKARLASFYSAITWDAAHLTEWVGQSGLPVNSQKLLYRYGLRVQQGDVFIAVLPDQTLLGAGIVASELGVMDGKCSRFIQWISADKTGQPIPINNRCHQSAHFGARHYRYVSGFNVPLCHETFIMVLRATDNRCGGRPPNGHGVAIAE